MDDRVNDHERRIKSLETAHQELHSDMRNAETRREMIEYRFSQIDGRFNKLDANIGKLIWLVIAALVGGIVSFILRGGLVL